MPLAMTWSICSGRSGLRSRTEGGVDVGEEDAHDRLASERGLADEGLVENAGERVLVALWDGGLAEICSGET